VRELCGNETAKLVDLGGVDPPTSSMPWKISPKLRNTPAQNKGLNIPAFAGILRDQSDSAGIVREGKPEAQRGLAPFPASVSSTDLPGRGQPE
jgi:hypothetical protein